jgi:hypothetical protein
MFQKQFQDCKPHLSFVAGWQLPEISSSVGNVLQSSDEALLHVGWAAIW